MAKNNKRADSGIRASKRSKVIVTTFIVVFVLVIAAYFVYISGLLPKVMTGVKITEEKDGVTRTIDNISVAEANYHYYQVLGTYYSYGFITSDMDMDTVYDETSGRTYRQMVLDQAADELMNSTIVNAEAKSHDYLAHSGASRYADLNLQSVEQTARLYQSFASTDAYLQALYGRGMSTRVFRNCLERQALTQEYENYVRQFTFAVSDEELDAAYDANPTVYQRVDFDYYFFAGSVNEDGSYDISEAAENADRVVSLAEDSDSFAAAVVDIIGDETASYAGFTDDSNPTHAAGYTSANADTITEGLGDFLFADERVFGDTITFETEQGVYAIMFEDRYTNDELVATYRTLTIYNEAFSAEDATQESIAAGLADTVARANGLAAAPMDSLAFSDLVKANSDSPTEIITAGYNEGTTESSYEDDEYLTDRDRTLGQWLFDGSRSHGDTLVLPSEDDSYVTIFYFENTTPEWRYNARTQIITGMVNSWSNDILSGNPSYAIAYDLFKFLSY